MAISVVQNQYCASYKSLKYNRQKRKRLGYPIISILVMHLVRHPTKAHRALYPLCLDRHAIRPRGIGSTVLDRAGPVESILGESARQRLLARNLLAADEAVDGDGDGAVDVVCAAVLGQSHLGECL